MFYDDFICSITNSFYGQQTDKDVELKNSKFFDELETLYILGKRYEKPIDEKLLQEDISSRFWFTYRKGFNNIGGDGPDTDQGWGCMLRCGQMMLAECLLRFYLDRDFKWDKLNNGNPFYWKILSFFRDEKQAPYSVQQIASMGVTEGVTVGKWFGPNTIIQVLKYFKAFSKQHNNCSGYLILFLNYSKLSTYDDSNHLKFYIAMDNCIFIDEIYEIMKKCNKCIKCVKHPKGVCNEWNPLLIVLPLRLGLNEFNEDYKDSIKKCLQLQQSVGMIGGKPYSAYYFYGYADDNLLYLDPHESQNYEQNLINDMKDETYHSTTMWKLKFSNLDPSIALGFICKTEEDFKNLIETFKKDILKDNKTSLFEIYNKRPTFDEFSIDYETTNKSEDDFILL